MFALTLAIALAAAPPADPPPGEAKKSAAPAQQGEAPWVLPPDGYAEALRRHQREEKSAAGLNLRAAAVPDGYRYLMARGFEELRQAGYREQEVKAKVRELHSKHKAQRGKVLFLLTIEPGGEPEHYFLQGGLKGHLTVAAGSTRTIQVVEEEPPLRLESWQVFEMQPDRPRKIYRKSLAHFQKELRAKVAVPASKAGDSTPLVLTLRNVMRFRDRAKEKDRRSAEGFSMDKRQLSTSSWADQTVPEINLTFYPGRWDFPRAPAGFDELLDRLAKE